MPIIENDVKRAMKSYLKYLGYTSVDIKLDTRRGYDVEGINSKTKNKLIIECKGEAQSGSQHSRSWSNVASALLTTLRDKETPENTYDVGMAFPDTKEYRGRMEVLEGFCKKQNISVYWVNQDGGVSEW